jgi:hypothetical protein
MAGDRRQLAGHEESLRKMLKLKSLVLSSLEHMVARQESRLLWLSEGDATTRFFHSLANSHRCKKPHSFPRAGRSGDGRRGPKSWEDQNAEAVFSFFDNIFGTPFWGPVPWIPQATDYGPND